MRRVPASQNVEQRTFLPTPPGEERACQIVLLAHTGPLRTLVALVSPPTAAGTITQALTAALFPTAHMAGWAILQLKAPGVFVSLVAAEAAEVRAALRDLTEQDSVRDGMRRVAPERRPALAVMAAVLYWLAMKLHEAGRA